MVFRRTWWKFDKFELKIKSLESKGKARVLKKNCLLSILEIRATCEEKFSRKINASVLWKRQYDLQEKGSARECERNGYTRHVSTRGVQSRRCASDWKTWASLYLKRHEVVVQVSLRRFPKIQGTERKRDEKRKNKGTGAWRKDKIRVLWQLC